MGFDTDMEKATKNKVSFTVSRSTPGTVSVKAIVVSGSVAETDPITLTFTGPQSNLSLSEPASTLLNNRGNQNDSATQNVNEETEDTRDVFVPDVDGCR